MTIAPPGAGRRIRRITRRTRRHERRRRRICAGEQRRHVEDQEQRRHDAENQEQHRHESKIASNAVTNAKIANGTIQPADLRSAAKTAGPEAAPGPQGPSGPGRRRGSDGLGSRSIRTAPWCETRARRPHKERRGSVPGDLQPGRDGRQLPGDAR